jgi:hypothetical protein
MQFFGSIGSARMRWLMPSKSIRTTRALVDAVPVAGAELFAGGVFVTEVAAGLSAGVDGDGSAFSSSLSEARGEGRFRSRMLDASA